MEDIVIKEKLSEKMDDEQISNINEQIKQLERQIVKIIE